MPPDDTKPSTPTSPIVPDNSLSELGSKPVVFEPAPLPGERPNVAPANVPHDAPPPPLPKKHHESPQTHAGISETESSTNPIGGVAYQPKTNQPTNPIDHVPQQPQVGNQKQSGVSVLTKLKKPLIIVGVFFVALILGSVIIKATTKKGSNSTSNSEQSSQNTGPTATAPDGYKVIDRPCFSFAILDTNLSIGMDNICFVIAKYGEKGISSLNVYPETRTYASIDEFSAAKKKEYNSKVVSEENTKIDGLDAKKVIETVGPNGQQYVRYYVLTPGKSYKYQDTAITGFEINSFYNDDFSRDATAKTIDSWKWK